MMAASGSAAQSPAEVGLPGAASNMSLRSRTWSHYLVACMMFCTSPTFLGVQCDTYVPTLDQSNAGLGAGLGVWQRWNASLDGSPLIAEQQDPSASSVVWPQIRRARRQLQPAQFASSIPTSPQGPIGLNLARTAPVDNPIISSIFPVHRKPSVAQMAVESLQKLDFSTETDFTGPAIAVRPLPPPHYAPPPVPLVTVPAVIEKKEGFRVTSKPMLSCPAGFRLIPGALECENEETQPADLGCREGWLYDGAGNCEGVETGIPDYLCPNDFKWTGSECVREEVAPKQAFCPHGYTISADTQCVRPLEAKATPICTMKGYRLSPNQKECTLPNTVEATVTCPEGYIYKGHNTPWKPAGKFSNHSGSCKRELHAPRGYRCPRDFNLGKGNVCIGIDNTEPQLGCPAGFQFSRGVCQIIEKTPAQYQCPLHAERVGDVCILEEQVARLPVPSPPSHDSSFAVRSSTSLDPSVGGYGTEHDTLETIGQWKGGRRQLGRRSKEKKKKIFRNRFFAPRRRMLFGPVLVGPCPDGTYEDDEHRCIRRQRIKPRRFCLQGVLVLGGEMCEIIQTRPAALMCGPEFQFEKGRCTREKMVPAIPTCPPDYTPAERDKGCIKVETFDLNFECPDHYVLNIGNPPFCSGTLVSPPEFECPPGYHLSGAHEGNVSGSYPLLLRPLPEFRSLRPLVPRRKRSPRLLSASPSPSAMSQTLPPPTSTPPPLPHPLPPPGPPDTTPRICTGRQQLPPELRCPNGFTEKSHRCTRLKVGKPFPACPRGFVESSNQCVRRLKEPATVMCPVGYEFRGHGPHDIAAVAATHGRGLCFNKIRTEAKPICAPGYQYDAIHRDCFKFQAILMPTAPPPAPVVQAPARASPPAAAPATAPAPVVATAAPPPPPQYAEEEEEEPEDIFVDIVDTKRGAGGEHSRGDERRRGGKLRETTEEDDPVGRFYSALADIISSAPGGTYRGRGNGGNPRDDYDGYNHRPQEDRFNGGGGGGGGVYQEASGGGRVARNHYGVDLTELRGHRDEADIEETFDDMDGYAVPRRGSGSFTLGSGSNVLRIPISVGPPIDTSSRNPTTSGVHTRRGTSSTEGDSVSLNAPSRKSTKKRRPSGNDGAFKVRSSAGSVGSRSRNSDNFVLHLT